MQDSKAENLRKLASKRQIVRAKDAKELGIPRTYLPRLARRGDLEMERPIGIEPTPEPWQGSVLPLY